MNDAFYTSQNEQFAQYSQQYFALVSEDTKDAVFQITYDTNGYTDNDIICTLIAPDDQTVYEMPALNGVATVTLDKAVAGRYTMNIYPKDIKVENAEVISGYTQKDAICDKETETLKKMIHLLCFQLILSAMTTKRMMYGELLHMKMELLTRWNMIMILEKWNILWIMRRKEIYH